VGITLIHARPYRPQGKGKIERGLKTVRAQWLIRLTPDDTLSLEALNHRLWGWLEGEYHQAPHRGFDDNTPLEQWAQQVGAGRFPESELDLDYEVDAALVGEKITLHFDPGAPPERPVQVSHQGKFIEQARPIQTDANCFVKRNRPSWSLNSDEPAPEPSPSGMTRRDLNNKSKETD